MKRIYLTLSIVALTVLVDARSFPPIKIYEIHDTDEGIRIKDINSDSFESETVNEILSKLLKPNHKEIDKITKPLIKKLKNWRDGHVKRIDDGLRYIYVLGQNAFGHEDTEASDEKIFVDKTRNERDAQRGRSNNNGFVFEVHPYQEKKVMDTRKPPLILRERPYIYDRTAAPRHRYHYDRNSDFDS